YTLRLTRADNTKNRHSTARKYLVFALYVGCDRVPGRLKRLNIANCTALAV
ncbi:hypothetical protein BIW11_13215, partial [Tropilaelaps mercedesae]